MSGLLASVTGPSEAETALAGGCDIIDMKNPEAGALGALPVQTIEKTVRLVAGRKPVSATIGDLPLSPQPVCDAVVRTAETGVDYIKIGFFQGDKGATLDALQPLTRRIRMVAVLFADQDPDFSIIRQAACVGFAGVMLDTADKTGGSLRRHLGPESLRAFIEDARSHDLLTGLAGSLSLSDVDPLLMLNPDYLGFRGALCEAHKRTAGLDPDRIATLRLAFEDHLSLRASQATANAGAHAATRSSSKSAAAWTRDGKAT